MNKEKKGGTLASNVRLPLGSRSNLKDKGRTSIKCSKCGDIKAVRREVFLKRIEKFGSVKRLLANYHCQKCRNGAKNGIQCVRCKEIKAVRRDVYIKRVERYGSEEKLIAKYLCRKCRRVVKHEQKMQARRKRR